MLGTDISLLLDIAVVGVLGLGVIGVRVGFQRRYGGKTWAPGSDLAIGSLIALVILCATLILVYAINSTR